MITTKRKNYLKAKTVFIVSVMVIIATFLTVWLTGIDYNRAITSNLYLSLSIIGILLFLFMTYGLYKGVGLKDDFPKYRTYKKGEFLSHNTPGTFETPDTDVGDGLAGIILSILLWILMTVAIVLLFIVLEALFWFSLFIIVTMLYWIFFRALKLVFSKSDKTVGDIFSSMSYSLTYTVLYLGWIFGIVFLIELF